jgi:glycosyltransferase involved in cell wall biosynthesis
MGKYKLGPAPVSVDVSIIVVNYNKPHTQIVECFQSIREQTVKPKEIFLIDDCSDDPRPHADAVSILLPKNVGVAMARDVGVRMSTGKLLLFVDADDKLAPDFLEESILTITKCDIAYPKTILFGEVPINKVIRPPDRMKPKNLINYKCSIPVTSLMKREVYEKLGGFNKELPIFEDWDFWIRAMCNGYSFRKANTFLWYRQNEVSRNNKTLEFKTKIYKQITSNLEIKGDTICRIEPKSN